MVVITEQMVAGFRRRHWLALLVYVGVASVLVGLGYHFTHNEPMLTWGWRHYVGVGLQLAPLVLLIAAGLWWATRKALN